MSYGVDMASDMCMFYKPCKVHINVYPRTLTQSHSSRTPLLPHRPTLYHTFFASSLSLATTHPSVVYDRLQNRSMT